MKFYENGFLVKELDPAFAKQYIGVETGEWPLVCTSSNSEIAWMVSFIDNNIALSWGDPDHVDVCEDFEFIKQYYKACKAAGLNVEVLYCQTTSRYPKCDVCGTGLEMELLGFDYAYPGGYYYSAVFNDIIPPCENLFPRVKVNRHGLLETEYELMEFIKDRKKMINVGEERIEGGVFIAFKLWRVILET